MSKITKALEKAARERLQHLQEQPTTKAAPVEMPIVPAATRIGSVSAAGKIQVDPHIVAATDPKSPISEQYRILRTNLQSLKFRPGAKVIVVTSAVHGEGKSVTSINMALTLSRQENLRVVLVDADLRKGSIHKWLGLTDRSEGLSGVLSRGGELNGELTTLQDPNLTILPAGTYPEDPAELLESSAMKRVIATLKSQFDVVIIDAPPVLPVSDPAILAAQADGVLLVVRAGKTQRKTVTQAHALLDQVKANIVGCVLTHVEYYLPGYYRYYHEYQYRAKNVESKQADAKGAKPAEAAKSDKPQAAKVAAK